MVRASETLSTCRLKNLEWQHSAKNITALINTITLGTNSMPGKSTRSGGHAARAKKAKATEAEGSAAAAALKVVKAQARADAAAEKKVADAARKAAAAQAKADVAAKNPYAGFE